MERIFSAWKRSTVMAKDIAKNVDVFDCGRIKPVVTKDLGMGKGNTAQIGRTPTSGEFIS
jgi:hypothetical protein